MRRQGDPARGFFLVLFHEVVDGAPPDADVPTLALASGDAARHFEEEVLRLKAQLRATVDRHETQAEELQVMNEELETSKEALRTVNQELTIKVEEQAQANDDIRNLINSTEIGIIFLDRASRIKLFTPQARKVFALFAADRGRPQSDINSALVETELHDDIEHVLERLERIDREVRTRDGRWHLMRLFPYRTTDDHITGVVLTFVDITERKTVEEQLRRSEGRMRMIVDSVTDHAIFTADVEGCIDTWNPGAARTFGFDEAEVLGQPMAILYTPEDRERDVQGEEMRQAAAHGRAVDERWHLRKDGSRFFASGVLQSLQDADGAMIGFVKIARDLTERKRWEDSLASSHAELELRVQQRTSELEEANEALAAELNERRQAEEQVRGLMRRLLTVQEDERRRIACDLHDHFGQLVAGLRLKIEGLAAVADGGGLKRAVEDTQATIARLDHDLDFFTSELRPASLDDLGLLATLTDYVMEWSTNFGIAVDLHTRGLDGVRLPYEIGTNVCRIAQEALNNVFKHAAATGVGVILEQRDREIVLIVEDDGRGFDPADTRTGIHQGLGLIGMRERAAFVGGTLEVEAAPGRGTTVFVRVPLVPPPDPAEI